ncbi:MAG: dUTP diphosphatase [Bacteroidetes bacterium]|nr:MAG: dUTP diphosphatase [Bacteroidota bacterium]
MKVKVVNKSSNELPKYQTAQSAGMDLRSVVENDILLEPLERVLVGTGIFIELPEGFEAQIRPRSGLAYKHGISVLNSPGTIDADYRGEIKVLLVNLSNEPYLIKAGERIAQMIIAEHNQADWQLVTDLGESERSAGGFGSTGTK